MRRNERNQGQKGWLAEGQPGSGRIQLTATCRVGINVPVLQHGEPRLRLEFAASQKLVSKDSNGHTQ